jgi:Tfp pilus assembly protein PilZ
VGLNIERRRHKRLVYEADISHDLLADNDIYRGKLYNFSKGGLYFESDQVIYPGEEVFLKFEDHLASIKDDILAQLPFAVEIVWQKELPDSSFRYGYGVHYIDMNDSLVKSIKIPEIEQAYLQDAYNNPATELDPRAYPRRQYHKSLRLQYGSKNYKGEFKNISRGGVFIKTDIRFTVGKKIRIVIPGSQIRKMVKLQGWIVRINTDGFGVKFDRRSGLATGRKIERRTGFDRRTMEDRRERVQRGNSP